MENLKALAARLSLVINFNYLTVSWSMYLDAPIIHLWNNKPEWVIWTDEYGDSGQEWEEDNWVAVIDLGALNYPFDIPKDTDFSKMIVKRA